MCCGYLCFRSSDLGQISSDIPLPASSLPRGTVSHRSSCC